MKVIRLTAVQAAQNDQNIILLAEKDTCNRLAAFLSANEYDYLLSAVEKDIKTMFFPRKNHAVWVRILKDDKTDWIAREDTRLAGAEVLREVLNAKIESVAIRDYCTTAHLLPFAEGFALGAYQFLKYFADAEKRAHKLREIQLETKDTDAVAELDHLVDAVFTARTLVNEPYSFLTTAQLCAETVSLGAQHGFSVEVLGKEKIEALKMGGLLSVNAASQDPPAFIILEHVPKDPINNQPVVLVGKGVVYDTGGHSIKTSDGMELMKSDMGGAATVVGLFVAAAKTKLPVHLIGLIPVTDNKISETGIVPGDIIRMASGKTVEVGNTDAEGRLILADALHYAARYKPELVIDYATLTGAAVRAVGQQATCYVGTADFNVKKAFERAGLDTYERLIEFPLWREYGDELRSQSADMRNVGGITAGVITAGKFLEAFVDGYPWLHLDIAGTAFLKNPTGYRTKEGTGVGVRLTYQFLKSWYKTA